MQITCPQCQILLEIPDHLTGGLDVLHIECGACNRRFKVALNRPSLKVRKPQAGQESRADTIVKEAVLEREVVLTTSPTIEGRQIEALLQPVASDVMLPGSEEERQAVMLDALAKAQEHLREQARALGADGVIEIQSEHLGAEESRVLRLSGTAVRLSPL